MIAPLDANTMAKMACGLSDNLLVSQSGCVCVCVCVCVCMCVCVHAWLLVGICNLEINCTIAKSQHNLEGFR